MLHGNEEEAVTWSVADPACGTGGFLVSFMEALREHFTTEDGVIKHPAEEGDANGKEDVTYTGDRLTPAQWKHIQHGMFRAYLWRPSPAVLQLLGMPAHFGRAVHKLSERFQERFLTTLEQDKAFRVAVRALLERGADA